MSAIDLVLSWLLTLVLHASVLLALAWSLERIGALRHPGWRELAWRGALFGALLSSVLATLAPTLPRPGGPAATQAGPAAAAATAARKTGPRADAAQAVRATLPGEAGLSRALARQGTGPSPGVVPSTSGPAMKMASPPTWRVSLPSAAGLLLAWTLGGLPVALRLLRQGWALRRWTRGQPGVAPRSGSRLPALIIGLGRELSLTRLPQLRLVDGLASPMLLPGRRLLLPAWVEELSPAQQRALLAHELTHLQRHDPAWRLAQRLAVLPLYFHPLAWLALRRLEALAEDACDERAAALCGSGRPLAECLAVCLARGAAPPSTTPTLAVAMAAEPGPVVRRVKNLLEETPMRRPIPASLRRTALALGLATAIALPGLAVTSVVNPAYADGFFSKLFSGTSVTNSDGKARYQHRNGRTGERQELTMRGGIDFTAAEDDVARMAAGAEFELRVKRDGIERSLRVVPGREGLERDYRVDGSPRAFDAAAREWLAEALPGVLRESGFQAEARARRILARGGLDALFAEIDLIEGDHSRGRYLQALFSAVPLDDAGFARALELAAGIDSDYELRRVLEAGLANTALTAAAQTQLLQVARKMGSDYEQSQLLVQLAKSQTIEGDVLVAWREVLGEIGSDYEQRKVLSALLGREEPRSTQVALESARAIGSDYEARQILDQAVPMARRDAGVQAAWFALLAGVGSDYEQRQALDTLIGHDAVDEALARAVLDSLGELGSGHETAQVLRALAAAMPAEPALIEHYRAVARRLSDHERGQAERALDRFAMAEVD